MRGECLIAGGDRTYPIQGASRQCALRGLRRDLLMPELFGLRREQELGNTPAPLHSASPRDALRSSRPLASPPT
jgi:hypothetical protein